MTIKRGLAGLGIAIALTLGGLFATSVAPASAQLDSGLAQVGETIQLPATDPRVIAARIINIALGLVGVLLVVIIIYAGFLYMTAGGDAKKTAKALAYIRNAIIGLIIILMSWAFARFVIDRLLQATGGGGGGISSGGGGGPGGGFGSSGSSDVFKIIPGGISPSGSVPTKKIIVKITFNAQVDYTSSTPAGMIKVEKLDGTPVDGTVSIGPGNNRELRFVPSQPCPPPNNAYHCFDDNTDYRVHVSPLLKSAGGKALTCGGFAPSCDGAFKSGTTVDLTPPTVQITYPHDGSAVSADALVDLSAYISSQNGVAYVEFKEGGMSLPDGQSAPVGNTPMSFDAHAQWDTAGLAVGSQHTLTATGYDADTGVSTSAPVNVIIRPQHCSNGSQDADESGPDCGGSTCGACSGSQCSSSIQCASSVCTAGVCVEQPNITSVTPDDGAVGSLITIKGINLGGSGKVTFLGKSGAGVDAIQPQACVSAGAQTWSPTEVVVEVPAGAQTGPLRLTNFSSGLHDDTNADPTPFINDFLINDTLRPGICAALPNEGTSGSLFRLIGTGFGNTAATLNFGTQTIASQSWIDGEVQALIPNVSVKTYPVSIGVGTLTSNPVNVNVIAKSTGGTPEIGQIDPVAGPIGTYVTLSGKNFGDSVGSVFFKDIATGNEALADTTFPAGCSASFWNDNSIIVKVPPTFTGTAGSLTPGSYTVQVRPVPAGTPRSNEVNFAVNTNPAAPGICGVSPSVAPIGYPITLFGERFTSGPGNVIFTLNKTAQNSSWNDTQIMSTIPTGAVIGNVTVTPSSNGLVSNGFKVDPRNCNDSPGVCKTGEECCGDGACMASGQCKSGSQNATFAWRSSTGVIPRAPRVIEECRTGQIPSPSPWTNRTGGDQACVNASIVVRFSSLVEPSTVLAGAKSILVYHCTGTGADPCVTKEAVALDPNSLMPKLANPTEDYLAIDHDPLLPNALYQVVLTTGIKGLGAEGANMVENAGLCGAGNAYCFRFRTRNDTNPCEIGAVQVSPDPFTANEQGQMTFQHVAVPLAKDDACSVLICKAYNWDWATSKGAATVTNFPDLTHAQQQWGACAQTVTAVGETGDDPVKIKASTAGVTGSADFYVKFIPPQVVDYGPHCDQACVNAAAWALFNVPLDVGSVNNNNVVMKECTNQNCLEFTRELPLDEQSIQVHGPFGTNDSSLRLVQINPMQTVTVAGVATRVPLMLPGRYYKVILKGGFAGGIQSAFSVPMTGLNDPDGFAWTFRTKIGDQASCVAERIDMAPMEKYETRVGESQAFIAAPFSSPDECSEKGQLLTPTNGFVWGSSNTNVATLLEDGMIDTGAKLPAGCSGTCKLLGASGRAGKTAQCGNGLVETTSKSYCVKPDASGKGTTAFGQGCLLLPPDGKGGEECDDANDVETDGCSNTCLWTPVASVAQGGKCGDSVIDQGEDCDFGRICAGAAPTSTTPNGFNCTSATDEARCLGNGGSCDVRMVRGCSPTCRNLGSVAGGSTCGNGVNDIGDGEDCDDGNLANGDGCSSNCLNEGSSRTTYALCGNGKLEPGEACEATTGGAWPAPGCDPSTCLHTGAQPCTSTGQALCCGNGSATDPGKDCDDGNSVNGDGCNSLCLAEGSSVGYATPSFCSNGALETGEQCESQANSGGDGFVDAVQIATIVGNDTPDVTTGKMSSNITATLDAKDGTAVYGLQCGFTDERMCSDDRATYSSTKGLTANGCCDIRPALADIYPQSGWGDSVVAGKPLANDPFPSGVCRNVLISGAFNTEMDLQSLQSNFVVAKRVQGDDCPSGTTDVTDAIDHSPKGFNGFVWRLWHRVLAWFKVPPAYAMRWCAGTVTGTLETKSASGQTQFWFTLDTALEPRTEYRVRFLGDNSAKYPLEDNADVAMRTGVKTKRGVVAPFDPSETGPLNMHFTTGDILCTLNNVHVFDLTTEHPNFYKRSSESHPFIAYAQAVVDGKVVPLSPTDKYAWDWQNWAFSNSEIIGIEPPNYPNGVSFKEGTTSKNVVSKTISGAGFLSARVNISADEVNVPSTRGNIVQGTAHLTVNLCEDPWPSIASAPFADTDGSPDLAGTPFEHGPFYNFSVTYCRDAGDVGPNGDLPGLLINPVPNNSVDSAQGVLRQYLFTFREANLQKDAIGVRILTNPLHLSPAEWYRARGFTGQPQSLLVDGYQAVRDGRTVYISAANTEGPNEEGLSTDIFSNIYLISYNEGAEPVTRQLYDALLKSMSFNVNVQYEMANVCEDNAFSIQNGSDGLPVTCSSDVECDTLGLNMHCASFKGKLQRDMIRLADFQHMANVFESAKTANKTYPTLPNGSFLPGISNSVWDSWNAALASGIGQGVKLPVDPVNRFVTCGRCSVSNTPCSTDASCSAGQVCVGQNGFDPATCWNSESKQFMCPNDPPGSRVYQYRALQNGDRFELAANFEVPPPNATNLARDWWKPTLFAEVKQCASGPAAGNFCVSDEDCRTCPLGICQRCVGGTAPGGACSTNAECGTGGSCSSAVPVVAGSCKAVGGQFKYTNVCSGDTLGATGTCGDGVLDVDPSHTTCLGGTNDGKACQTSAGTNATGGCPGGACLQSEICELKGPTAKRFVSCVADKGAAGQRVQTCSNCRAYVDSVEQPSCYALNVCGNGKVDGLCSNDQTKGCATNADCANGTSSGTCQKQEACDDGALNGSYGKCKADCSGYGNYCGDGQVSLGETCDLGANNGKYCLSSAQGGTCTDPASMSCGLTCKGKSTYCGDGLVTAPETCDGNTETTSKSVCQGGQKDQQPCDTNADCGGSIKCEIIDGGVSLPNGCLPGYVCAGPDGICSTDSHKYCTQDADCGASGATCLKMAGKSCGSANSDLCGPHSVCQGPVPYVMTRACVQPGVTVGLQVACQKDAWSSCHPASYCGNGAVDAGEACDDGNADDTDSCTTLCTKNMCGDGRLLKGVEECDNGADNGKVTCSAEYGSTCTSCSKSCKFQLSQGGYCGDKIKNQGSPEQCDGTDGITSNITCKGLGYDYAYEYKTITADLSKVAGTLPGGGCVVWKRDPVPATSSSIIERLLQIFIVNSGYLKPGVNTLPLHSLGSGGAEAVTPNPNITPDDIVYTANQTAATYPAGEGQTDTSKYCFGAKVSFTGDVITCSSSCGFTGCGYCGSTPGVGKVEGTLNDTLFQKPVPNARVTLFYRGIQQAVTSADASGYFVFQNLDTHAGCNQYKLVVDSYADNPLTKNFNESKRGGYLPVTVSPFEPNNESLLNTVTNAKQGQGVTDPNSGSYQIAQINMLPRLGNNEYITQLWWSPDVCNGTPNSTKSGVTYDAAGCPTNSFGKRITDYEAAPDKAAFYNKYLNDYHDLVVRVPFTYTPGTYGSCALPTTPKPYTGNGSNQSLPTTARVDYPNPSTTLTDSMTNAVSGMASCTNKIRAAANRVCVIRNTSGGSVVKVTNFGCSDSWDCENPAKYNINAPSGQLTAGQEVKCLGPSDGGGKEPERSGPLSVLDGAAGAYLFCFHPETPDSDTSDCSNFILPPQSAFISGKGGQYDIIVSQFRMFDTGVYGPQTVRQWLRDHNAEIRLYDKNGLYDRWNFKEIDNKQTSAWPAEAAGDQVCTNQSAAGKVAEWSGWLPTKNFPALYNLYAQTAAQSWTPISIDTSAKSVKVWSGGNDGAEYRYFSDLYNVEGIRNYGAGSGVCWAHTCERQNFTDGSGSFPTAGKYFCNGAYYSGNGGDPACDTATRDMCKTIDPTWNCAKTVVAESSGKSCVKLCGTNGGEATAGCQGTVAGSFVPAFCGGPYACASSKSDLAR